VIDFLLVYLVNFTEGHFGPGVTKI